MVWSRAKTKVIISHIKSTMNEILDHFILLKNNIAARSVIGPLNVQI